MRCHGFDSFSRCLEFSIKYVEIFIGYFWTLSPDLNKLGVYSYLRYLQVNYSSYTLNRNHSQESFSPNFSSLASRFTKHLGSPSLAHTQTTLVMPRIWDGQSNTKKIGSFWADLMSKKAEWEVRWLIFVSTITQFEYQVEYSWNNPLKRCSSTSKRITHSRTRLGKLFNLAEPPSTMILRQYTIATVQQRPWFHGQILLFSS